MASFISSFTSQFGQLINSQSAARKLMLLAIILGSVAAMVYLIIRAQTGGFVPIQVGMDPADAGMAIKKLNQMDIAVRTEAGGTTILVPRHKSDDATIALAMDGLLDSGIMGYELMDRNSLGDSKWKQEKNYVRVREGELARILQSIEGVESARVMLAIPEDQLFVKEEQPPKASVTLRLRRGTRLNDQQVNGVVHLVSSSVDGMLPENVSVIDSGGNLLSHTRDSDATQATSAQLAFKERSEKQLKDEIVSALERTIGRDRVHASVQMEYDFSSMHQVEEIYNPLDQDPIIETEKSTMSYEGADKASGMRGATGSDSNLPFSEGAEMGVGEKTNGIQANQRQDLTRDYAVSKRVQESSLSVPQLKRITVGVLVDGRYEEITGTDGELMREFRSRNPEEMSDLENVIKAIMGFNNTTRQDVLELSCVPFQTNEGPEAEETFLTYEMRRLIERAIEWGVVGILALLMILLVLKPAVKQIIVTPASSQKAALPHRGAEARELQGALESGERSELTAAAQAAGIDLSDIHEGMSDDEIAERIKAKMQKSQFILDLQNSKKAEGEIAQQVHKEIQNSARENPQRTVSLIRQWMEEG